MLFVYFLCIVFNFFFDLIFSLFFYLFFDLFLNFFFNLFFYFKIAVLFNRLFFNHFTLICYSYFFQIDIHTLLRNLIHYPKLIRLHNSLKCHILPLPRLFHIKWLNRSTLRLIHSIRPYYHAHLFLRNIPLLNC